MFRKSSLQIVLDVRTKWKQEAVMTRKVNKSAETNLVEDLAGMVALVVLLFVGLHLPLVA
jgi:hypothetical protein